LPEKSGSPASFSQLYSLVASSSSKQLSRDLTVLRIIEFWLTGYCAAGYLMQRVTALETEL
jgi:hypothetical protein